MISSGGRCIGDLLHADTTRFGASTILYQTQFVADSATMHWACCPTAPCGPSRDSKRNFRPLQPVPNAGQNSSRACAVQPPGEFALRQWLRWSVAHQVINTGSPLQAMS